MDDGTYVVSEQFVDFQACSQMEWVVVDHDLVLRYAGDLVRGQTQIPCIVTLFLAGSSLSHSRRTVAESAMASTTSAGG